MEYSPYIFLGMGAAISVLGFFLKRIKEDVDVVKSRNTRLEVNAARDFERIKYLEKITEDRREDIKRIYEVISK